MRQAVETAAAAPGRGRAGLRALAWLLVAAAAVLVAVPSPAAAAAPGAGAGQPGQMVVAQEAVVLPADGILDDALDWAREKGSEVADWVRDRVGGIAERTGDALKVLSPAGAAVAAGAQAVNDAAEGWVQEALEGAARWVASTLGRAVAWLLATTIALVFSVTSPNLDAPFVYTWSGRVFAFAIPITILFALYQVAVTSVRMRGLAGLRRAAGGALFGTVASMVTLPLVAVVARGVDEVKMAFVGYLEVDTQALSQKIVDVWSSETFTALAEASPTGAAAASAAGISFMLSAFAFFCFLTLLFTFGLLVVMVIRNVMLHGVVVLAPLAWSGLAAEPTRAWPRTVLGWIAAILVAPLGVVVILGLSVSALADLGSPETLDELVGQLVLSGAMFLLAFLVPFACFSMFSFMGEAAVGAMHREVQDGVEKGAETVGDTAGTVVAAAAAAGAGVATGGAAAGAGAAAASEGASSSGAAGGQAGAGSGTAGAAGEAAGAGAEASAGGSEAGPGTRGPGKDPGADADGAGTRGEDPGAGQDGGGASAPVSGPPEPGSGLEPAPEGGGREASSEGDPSYGYGAAGPEAFVDDEPPEQQEEA